MSLTVSIAVHNPDLKMFRKMLESLTKYSPDMTQLIIVNNASKNIDQITEVVTSIFIEWLLLDSEKNVGFGEAHNSALKKATGEYFAVVNDDVEFFENWTTPMINTFKANQKVKQVGMKQDTCGWLTITCEASPVPPGKEPDYIEASCMMMKTEDAKAYGLFSDKYKFAYFEDTDLSLRIKRDGYELAQVDLKWKHYRAKTSERVVEDLKGYHTLNRYTFQEEFMSYLIKKKFGRTIVVRRTGSIGDVLLTVPVIRAIKERYPDAIVVLATSCPQAVQFNPLIDLVTVNPHQPFPCDIFIDLDNSYERDFRKNIVDIYASVSGVKVQNKREMLAATQDKLDKVKSIVTFGEPYVALDLSDTWAVKQWPYENYMELADRISKLGYKIVLFGACNYNKKKFIRATKDFVNQLDVIETGILLSCMKVVIAHEGLSIHLAQASNVPAIGLYSCQLPEYTNDTDSNTLYPVITPAVCRGCRHRYCAGNLVLCPRNSECIKMITVDMAYKKFCDVISKLGI